MARSEAGGEVIGVIIPSMHTAALAHAGLTRMDVVPEMHARKARMHELADGYIALPGGFGTMDELFEAITWGQIGAHEKPIGLLNVKNYYAPLLAAIDHAVQEGFVFREAPRGAVLRDGCRRRLIELMENHKPPREAVRAGGCGNTRELGVIQELTRFRRVGRYRNWRVRRPKDWSALRLMKVGG